MEPVIQKEKVSLYGWQPTQPRGQRECAIDRAVSEQGYELVYLKLHKLSISKDPVVCRAAAAGTIYLKLKKAR